MKNASRAALAALVLLLGGCGDEPTIAVGRGIQRPGGAAPVPGTPAPGPAAADPGSSAPRADAGPPRQYRDEDFVEADSNRDPFRPYAEMFVARAPTADVQRRVIMGNTTIDEMRLVAIVSGLPNPSAMLVDRAGLGHVVRRGDYLGRAESVQTGGDEGLAITLNWRVDRIRPAEVVLTRDDPTTPDRVPMTRVLPLHDASDDMRDVDTELLRSSSDSER